MSTKDLVAAPSTHQSGESGQTNATTALVSDPSTDLDFPGGGGGASLANRGLLQVDYSASAVASASDPVGVPATSGFAYAADLNTDLGHFSSAAELAAAGPDGLLLGAYRVNHSGADSVWFTEAGLYVAQVQLVLDGSSGECGVHVDCGGASPIVASWENTATLPRTPAWSFTFVVTSAGAAATTGALSAGDTVQVGAWQASGAPQDLVVHLSLTRVL